MFKKILIANRGEIAVRIARACRELGVATVAVYSDADEKALHTQVTDEAVRIGEAAPAKSYLNIDALIAAARQTGAQAIHPGYGFLSERAAFAQRCEQEKIAWIGPNVKAIEAMGNKLASRELAVKHKVPVTPGSKGGVRDLKQLEKEATAIGFPVLIKAAAGGGGKGMRVVDSAKDLQAGLEMAMSESKKAFGDDTVFIEKYVRNGRHIEFQVLGDKHGHLIHLCERECSIQRRHQKIVEETPSVALTPKLRAQMGEAAVRLAKAVGYDSAGTVEFLLDETGDFYLLEMNTRIQVEHPITEMVTGVDLVKWQIRIAAGEKLAIKQDDLAQRGHAIECRVYAEDAQNNFFPCPGKILQFVEPQGPGVRNDCGVYPGFEVTVDYDPMLSKLITWDETREGCRKRMLQALQDYVVLGVKTTVPYLRDVLNHKAFIKGETYTGFIPTHMKGWSPRSDDALLDEALIAAALAEGARKGGAAIPGGGNALPEPWQTVGRWEIGGVR